MFLLITQILLLLTTIIQAGGYGLIRPLSNYGSNGYGSNYGSNYGYGSSSNYEYDNFYDNSIRPGNRPNYGGYGGNGASGSYGSYRPGSGYGGLDYGSRGDYNRGGRYDYYGDSGYYRGGPQSNYYGRPSYYRGEYYNSRPRYDYFYGMIVDII